MGRRGLYGKDQSGLKRDGMKPLRVGFVPLVDCAPLVMAQELGLFQQQGLTVRLSREVGWATIRDKIIYGELDAAHALAAMPFAATFGLGCATCDCLTGLVLNLNGNGITLSNELWDRGVRDATTFRQEIERCRGTKTYTLGVVFNHSTHNFLLRRWLAGGGIDPDADVRIVVAPAPFMFDHLKTGHLDGYCVGEPWNSVAIQAGRGWCVATSAQLAPYHPEKVLAVRRQFAEENEREHLALIAALIQACDYCDRMENREHVIQALAGPKYVNTNASALRGSLMPTFHFGNGRSESMPDFHVFSRHAANEPTAEKASWILANLFRNAGAGGISGVRMDSAFHVFRPDIFQQAVRILRTDPQARAEMRGVPVSA